MSIHSTAVLDEITGPKGETFKPQIGNNVAIGPFVYVGPHVILEDDVFCGPSMVFTNIKLPRSEFPQRSTEFYKKTLVKKSASIGANATIICGVTIGEYALIGSGAVVTKNVPDYALVVGNPGKVVGWVDKKGNKIKLNDKGVSSCKLYKLKNSKLYYINK